MHFKFAEIRHIDEVLSAIEGRDAFIVKDASADGYKVVNYLLNTPDTFPTFTGDLGADRVAAVLRECRGIKFCSVTGNIVARPFHKFFNWNEREESGPNHVSFEASHFILEKMDGSMLHPMRLHTGQTVWCTKMGPTDVAKLANDFLRDNPQYDKFAKWCYTQGELGWTPIFEFCSRRQRIVIDYPVEQMVLLAVRDNVTGEYIAYGDV